MCCCTAYLQSTIKPTIYDYWQLELVICCVFVAAELLLLVLLSSASWIRCLAGVTRSSPRYEGGRTRSNGTLYSLRHRIAIDFFYRTVYISLYYYHCWWCGGMLGGILSLCMYTYRKIFIYPLSADFILWTRFGPFARCRKHAKKTGAVCVTIFFSTTRFVMFLGDNESFRFLFK